MHWSLRLLLSLMLSFLLGLTTAVLFPQESFSLTVVSSGILFAVAIFVLWSLWHKLGGTPKLGWMILLAFALRILLGFGSALALPHWGNDNESNQAGYLFLDASRRDQQAWQLSQSSGTVLFPSSEVFYSDQYGGLLTTSAAIYRYLSPDLHRPFLILIFGAFIFSLGIPFFYQAVSARWGAALGSLGSWILILYPDGILYTSSQMREPIILGFSMVAFWAVLHWQKNKKTALILGLLSFAALFFFSYRMAMVVAGFLGVFFLIEQLIASDSPKQRWLFSALAVAGFALILISSLDWLKSSAAWDMLTVEANSGWVIKVLEAIGEKYRTLFFVVYGITQPLLPATIAHPTVPFLKTINILRAAGWYFIVPLLFYAVFSWFRLKEKSEKMVWAWLILFTFLWVVLASARAGGDFWDNPRYRINFLPLIALVTGWAILQARKLRDHWLVIWYMLEIVFLGYFTFWYFSRYYGSQISIFSQRKFIVEYIIQVLVIGAVLLTLGFLYPTLRKRFEANKAQKNKPPLP